MKYKITIDYEMIRDVTDWYNELINDGYLPDEAEKHIKQIIKEDCVDRLNGHADNILWSGYTTYYNIEEIDD